MDFYFFWGGTGMPGIFTLTAPRWLRLVKSVAQDRANMDF
jgi:hypothetical protein